MKVKLKKKKKSRAYRFVFTTVAFLPPAQKTSEFPFWVILVHPFAFCAGAKRQLTSF